ncbi:MAG TPA: peptidoglycan-binding protein [Acidiferrobacterales bacterium]|nr:peptidoglycan-binding protein [Acidiferrobacterales bacterium]
MRKQKGWLTGGWTIFEAVAVMCGLILLYVLMGYGDARAATVEQLEVHAAKVELAYDLPTGMLRAICEQESHWRNVAGQHGEIGVCQIKPATVQMVCNCKDNAHQVFFQRGARGDTVRQIQAQLTMRGYAVEVDGVYGRLTEKAVAAFQRATGAKSDGVVGPSTWALLYRGDTPYPGGTIAAALWNPYKNVEWAAVYLVWLRENVSEDPAVLLAAYNGGPANPVVKYVVGVQRRMAKGGM